MSESTYDFHTGCGRLLLALIPPAALIILPRVLLSLAGPRLRLRFSSAPAKSGNAALILAISDSSSNDSDEIEAQLREQRRTTSPRHGLAPDAAQFADARNQRDREH
jgi:hypothetical protein